MANPANTTNDTAASVTYNVERQPGNNLVHHSMANEHG